MFVFLARMTRIEKIAINERPEPRNNDSKESNCFLILKGLLVINLIVSAIESL